jgi:hypothetical protein
VLIVTDRFADGLQEMMRGRNMAKVRQLPHVLRPKGLSMISIHNVAENQWAQMPQWQPALGTDAGNGNYKHKNRLATTSTTCAVYMVWAEDITVHMRPLEQKPDGH